MTTPEPADETQPMDTGDIAAVGEDEQTEDDAPEPNDDADDDLADVEDGDVVELDADEDAGG